jgi:signal transduction histidine kinase
LTVGAQRGYSPKTVARLAFRPGQGIAGRVASTGQTLIVEDAATDPRTDPRSDAITASEGVRSYICVPIIVNGSVFGVFNVVYSEPRTFSDEDRRALEALAQRAAVAVRNAELHERMQSAAALEERQRLARELHDAVTQTLFSASLIAEVLPRVWERDPSQGRVRLEELRRLNRGALAEMRTLLLELRPQALTETPLESLLRQLVEASMSHAAIAIDVVVEGTPREVAGDVQVALYRLAQEALNNVVRHAHAQHAEVRLQWTQEGLTMRIRDDGQGFDQSKVPPGHLGVGFMRERAAALGASIEIASEPARGTTVTIVWPKATDSPSLVSRPRRARGVARPPLTGR